MPTRTRAVLAATALAVASLTACQGDGAGTHAKHASWLRTETAVYQLATADGALIGLRVTEKKRLQLLSIDPDNGKVRHRRATKPPEDWDADYGRVPILAGGHAIAYDGSALDVLDPVTFKTLWSYSSPVHQIRDCRPHVCVLDAKDTYHVLDGDTGKELWTSESDVFWVGTLVRTTYSDEYPNWTIKQVDPDDGSARHGWSIHPTKSHFASTGFGFAALTSDTIAIRPVDSDNNPLATDLYDVRTGKRLWSRKKLDVRYFAGHYIGLEAENRAIHFLDPKTGKDRWVAKAPDGHVFDAEYPVAVDEENAIWLGLHEAGSSDVGFAPVDDDSRELGKLKPSRDTVVFARTPKPRPVTVRVDGKARELDALPGYRPVDSSDGSLVPMPTGMSVPKALTLGKDLQPRDEQYPYLIGKDGHAIID